MRSTLVSILARIFPIALLSTAAYGLAPSYPGSIDPTYGSGGVLAFSVRSGYEGARTIVAAPEGKWIVSGGAQAADGSQYVHYLTRLQADGRIDTTFGAQGLVLDTHYYAKVIAVQASGKILAATTTATDGLSSAVLHRLQANGTRDLAFGTSNGETAISTSSAALPGQDFDFLDHDAEGRILAITRIYSNDFSSSRIEVWRLSADGIPDTAFGTGGRANLEDIAPVAYNGRARAQADGKIIVATWCYTQGGPTNACVVRLNADGTRDSSFGPNGLRKLIPPAGASYPIYDVRPAPDGKVYVVGTKFGSQPATALIFRFNTDGTLDGTYGNGGIAALTFTGQTAYAFAIQLLADGRQIVIGGVYASSSGFGYVARLTANGQLDTTFGTGGVGPAVPTANYAFEDGAVLADGSILAVGRVYNTPATSTDVDTMLVRYIGVEITTGVTEFYNTTLNHYFITADPAEAAAIDGGAAGPGWVRTGQTWKSGGPNRVCRFYGSPDINPATGLRRGPNSHFYTIETAECAAVKTDIGWRFESYDFNGWPAGVAGCAAGTAPVKRVYNGRFAQNDSNHRYMTSDALYAQMLAQGWSGEGTVFCAVQ